MKRVWQIAFALSATGCVSAGVSSTAVALKDSARISEERSTLDYRLAATSLSITASYEIVACSYAAGEEPIKLSSASVSATVVPDPSSAALYTIDPNTFGGIGIDVTDTKLEFRDGMIASVSYGSSGAINQVIDKTIDLVGAAGGLLSKLNTAGALKLPCTAAAEAALLRLSELKAVARSINREIAKLDKQLSSEKDLDASLKRRKSLSEALDTLALEVTRNRETLRFDYSTSWMPTTPDKAKSDSGIQSEIDLPTSSNPSADNVSIAVQGLALKTAIDPKKVSGRDASFKALLELMRFTVTTKAKVVLAPIGDGKIPTSYEGVLYREPVPSTMTIDWNGRLANQDVGLLQFGPVRGIEFKGAWFGTRKRGAKWGTDGRLTEFTITQSDQTGSMIDAASSVLTAERSVELDRAKREQEELKAEKDLIEIREALAKLQE